MLRKRVGIFPYIYSCCSDLSFKNDLVVTYDLVCSCRVYWTCKSARNDNQQRRRAAAHIITCKNLTSTPLWLCLPPESDPVVPPWDGWKALARTRSFCFFAVGAETGQDSRGPRERLAGYALCRTQSQSAQREGGARWRKRKEAGAGAAPALACVIPRCI